MTRKRVDRSEEQWCQLIAEPEASGKTQEEYCGEASIAITSFQKWRQRLRKEVHSTKGENGV